MNPSSPLEIVGVDPSVTSVPIGVPSEASISIALTLNFVDTYLRYIKAVKNHLDPISDCIAFVTGTACCCLVFFAQAEENSRPATRYDAVYAEQERRRDRQERGIAFTMGSCLGDATVDTASISVASIFCLFPSIYHSQCNPKLSTDSFLGLSAEELDNTKLLDSCGCNA